MKLCVTNNMKEISYKFDLPIHHKPIIKVVGVGGGGSNAINNMYSRGIKDVSFIVCNTDAQALQSSPIQNKLQIGAGLTGGLGAGANPEVGKNAAIESKESIKDLLGDDTKMLFITAGMGGGTGTGAAPVIAGIAKKKNILTVGIVTLPFSFEGKKKLFQAQEGIKELRENCDTVLIILNDRLQDTLGKLSISNAFLQADDVLTTAAKSIAEIITVPGYVNVDFEDVKTVMKDAGAAVMGSGQAEGDGRALKAAQTALSSPLLDYQDVRGARKILLSIVSGQEAELQMDELTVITNYIQEQTGSDAEMIFGHGADPELLESIRVTVIATGFEKESVELAASNPQKVLEEKVAPIRKQGYLFDIEDQERLGVDDLNDQYVYQISNKRVKNQQNKDASSIPLSTVKAGDKPTYSKTARSGSLPFSYKKSAKSDEKYNQELDTATYLRRKIQLLTVGQIPEEAIIRHHLYSDELIVDETNAQ